MWCAVLPSTQKSIFARGLGSYMVRIGIIFAIVTIVMMEIVLFPQWLWGWAWVLEDHGVYHPLSGADGSRLAVRSDTQLTGDEFFLQPFFIGGGDGDFAATGTNLYGATA